MDHSKADRVMIFKSPYPDKDERFTHFSRQRLVTNPTDTGPGSWDTTYDPSKDIISKTEWVTYHGLDWWCTHGDWWMKIVGRTMETGIESIGAIPFSHAFYYSKEVYEKSSFDTLLDYYRDARERGGLRRFFII